MANSTVVDSAVSSFSNRKVWLSKASSLGGGGDHVARPGLPAGAGQTPAARAVARCLRPLVHQIQPQQRIGTLPPLAAKLCTAGGEFPVRTVIKKCPNHSCFLLTCPEPKYRRYACSGITCRASGFRINGNREDKCQVLARPYVMLGPCFNNRCADIILSLPLYRCSIYSQVVVSNWHLVFAKRFG